MSGTGSAYQVRRSAIGSDPMTRRFPAWPAGAVVRVALGPGALGAGTAASALQRVQLGANGAPPAANPGRSVMGQPFDID